MNDFIIVRELPEAEWRHYLDTYPKANIFHTPEMYEVFGRAQSFQPDLWAAVQGAEIVALFVPVRIKLQNKMLAPLPARAVAFGGILCASSPRGQEAATGLLSAYRRDASKRLLFTELRNLSNLETIQPILQQQGFEYEDHLDYLIDLSISADAAFQRFTPKTRKGIRHALRQGDVTIEELSDRAALPSWYEVLQQTYRRARVPLPNISLFEAAFDVLRPKGMIRFTQAGIGHAIAAVSVELLYKQDMYGWYGGLDRRYGNYGANELLMWRILEWGVQQGFRQYDFGGAGKPDEKYGVRDFKAKFGGELVSYGRNTLVHRPVLLRMSQLGYQFFRRWL